MEKIWEDIPKYEGLYKINSKGDVLNIKRNRLMKKAKDKYYGYISGCCKGKVKSVKGFVWKYIEEE